MLFNDSKLSLVVRSNYLSDVTSTQIVWKNCLLSVSLVRCKLVKLPTMNFPFFTAHCSLFHCSRSLAMNMRAKNRIVLSLPQKIQIKRQL